MARLSSPSRGRARWSSALALVTASVWLVVISSLPAVTAVKRHDFKTCDQSGFCRRNRALADRAIEKGDSWRSPYQVHDPQFSRGSFKARVSNALFPTISFALELRFLKDGTARVIMDEVDGLRQRYNEAAQWALEGEPAMEAEHSALQVATDAGATTITYAQGRHQVRIDQNPLTITFLREGQPHVVLNEPKLFNMEHFRVKTVGEQPEEVVVQDPEHPEEQLVVVVKDEAYPGFLPPNEDGMWEETFNGKTDSKPKGPESLSLDITFPGYEHVYGIPEHASTLSLKTTRGGENAYTDPYRLYNLDVFEYEADSEMALYGSIPFMQAQRAGSSVAVFLATGSELWVDVTKTPTSKAVSSAFKKGKKAAHDDAGPAAITTSTHWMAESGILDLFVFLGPTPSDVFDAYTTLTGRAALPQLFALAYQQCRWNYLNEDDVLDVQRRFDEADIPLESLWLDIEYAHEHEYFIWDRRNFPTPEKMQEKLAEKGRKLIAIVDPHIKRDPGLYVYKEAQDLDILCKQPDGKTELEGWCWTGSSSWVDWFNPKSHDWWIKLFRFDKFKGSTPNLFIWNDMNEPSVFNGPEITMQKDAIHHGGWEHRDVHNINGMVYQNLSSLGLIEREDPAKRPFVLTRAYYAGSQRYGAAWTGDNLGDWPHLQNTVPMLLSNGISGMPFTGSDVGGFFGNPPPEMMTRWYQIGTFSPFFRAHGHIDTKRREPYLFDEPYQGIMRDAIRLRYSIMPAFYTAFFQATQTGLPIMRPQYVVFPNDPKGFALDDQFYLGEAGLLVKPVAQEGQTEQEIYLADDQPYYHYLTNDIYFGASHGGSSVKVPAPLESIPILQRGGHILPRRDLVRRAATLMWRDPITLVIATDLAGTSAVGSLYLDDGETFDYVHGNFVHRQFELQPHSRDPKRTLVLRNRAASGNNPGNAYAQKIADVTVSEVIVKGLPSRPSCVRLEGQSVGLEFEWSEGVAATASRRSSGKTASVLSIKDTKAAVIHDWDVLLEFEPSKSCSNTPAVDRLAALQSPKCPAGRFLCRNEGHIPSCILISRVNDGVCDPECCDGSDETDGKVSCGNRCAAVGDAHRKETAEADRKRRVGASVRADYIKFGSKERAKLEDDLAKTVSGITALQEREQSAKKTLEALEQEEAGDIARKKDSQLYQRIVDMQDAIKALRIQRRNLEGQVSDLGDILTDLSRDFNPNYQDMAVLGATRAYRDWRESHGLPAEASGDENEQRVPASTAVKGEEAVVDHLDEELKKLEDEDPLSLIDSINLRVAPSLSSGVTALFRVEDYLPEKWRPSYDAYKQSLVDVLVRAGIIYPPVPATGSDRPELLRARSQHSALVEQIEDAEGKKRTTEEQLAKDWGRDWEWKKLDGTCVEKNTGEYTYSVCFFGEASQRSNNNNVRTSLGRFKGWAPEAEAGSDEYYQHQVYDEGQRCWNGPQRSAKVDLICGTSNELLSVIEPEKCEYLFKVTSPAVCFPKEEKINQTQVKDEL